YAVPEEMGLSSLRVGNDGHARIVYPGGRGLRYAVFTGSRLRITNIPNTSIQDAFPALALDAHDNAHVLWSHDDGGRGGLPVPTNGPYYATNAGGTWSSPVHLTTFLGATSLTLDVQSGRPHVLIAGQLGVRYYTKSAAGWNGQTISSARTWAGALKQDQTS